MIIEGKRTTGYLSKGDIEHAPQQKNLINCCQAILSHRILQFLCRTRITTPDFAAGPCSGGLAHEKVSAAHIPEWKESSMRPRHGRVPGRWFP